MNEKLMRPDGGSAGSADQAVTPECGSTTTTSLPTITSGSVNEQPVQACDYTEYAEPVFTAERPQSIGVRLDRRALGATYSAAFQNALAVFASHGHAPDLVQFSRDLQYLIIPDTGEDARAVVREARASFVPQPGLTRAAAVERLRAAVRRALIEPGDQPGDQVDDDLAARDPESAQALASATSIGAVLDVLRENGYDYPAAVSVLIAALVVDARPEDEPASSYEWSTWRMVVQPVPDRRRGPTPRQGRWNLRINEATQPAAQGLLDDLQARYGARLEIVRAVHAGKKGEWLAYLYLRPQPHADD